MQPLTRRLSLTTNSYNVTDLDPATTYFYDVKAVFGGKSSNWSNKIMVTTLAGGILGDVNGDGDVNSVDVTILYNYLLNGDTENMVNGDQNGDGEITSVDITVVYNVLLGAKK